MNKSNKILIGFFLIVFLIPVLMVMAFKSKIRNGDYVIVNRDEFSRGHWNTGRLKAPRVIKLSGTPGNALKVNVSYSDRAGYSFAADFRDSVRIHESRDTVFINYNFIGDRPDDVANAEQWLDLSIPAPEHLIMDNVEVNLLSLDSSGTKSMTLEMRGTTKVYMGLSEENNFNRHRISPVRLDQLSVKMDNAGLYLGKNINIRQMNIDASGSSTISINKEVVIGEIRGTLSDSSSVDASWNYLKKLNAMPVR